MSKKTDRVAVILEKVAYHAAKSSVNSRCMYILHQPKGIKELRK